MLAPGVDSASVICLNSGASVRAFCMSCCRSSSDLEFNHLAVLLFENKIIPSIDKVVAFGFSRNSLSSFAKSLSLTVLVLGTDFVSDTNQAEGLSYIPPGK